jgi:hypothetical protein
MSTFGIVGPVGRLLTMILPTTRILWYISTNSYVTNQMFCLKDDINFVAACWSWLKNRSGVPGI